MSERQLPWYVKRPEEAKEYGVGTLPNTSRIGYSVWDGAGAFVCVCWGEERGYNEALAIVTTINRAGDRDMVRDDAASTVFCPPWHMMSPEQNRRIQQDAQNIVDIATARLRDERITDPNTRHDLEQIVFSAKRLHHLTGVRAHDLDEGLSQKRDTKQET